MVYFRLYQKWFKQDNPKMSTSDSTKNGLNKTIQKWCTSDSTTKKGLTKLSKNGLYNTVATIYTGIQIQC